LSDYLEREYSGEIRRTRAHGFDGALRHNYVGMQGRVSVEALLTFLAENTPDTGLDQVFLNWTTAVWVDPATAEELSAQAAAAAKRAAALEAWERKTLAELTEKYGVPVAAESDDDFVAQYL
jgi:hypothetical protein